MLDDFRKENEIELGAKRRLGFAQVPVSRFHTVPCDVRQMWSWKVRRDAVITPQFRAHKGQLPSADIQNVNSMRRSQCSKSANAFFVPRSIPFIVRSPTKLEFILTDEAVIQ